VYGIEEIYLLCVVLWSTMSIRVNVRTDIDDDRMSNGFRYLILRSISDVGLQVCKFVGDKMS
jgi:hypothetical protein